MGEEDELVARDLPEFLKVMEEMKGKVQGVRDHVEQLTSLALSPDNNTENGIGLLEVKVHLLLSSLINLVQLMLMKTEGKSISSSPPVLRLVEIRTVLEKLRPLDHKLSYQVDKLIRMATTGAGGVGNDPLRFRANPANMVSKLGAEDKREEREESEVEDDDEEDGETNTKLYVPPRVVAMPYDGEDDEGKRNKRKKVQSSIVEELRNEYLDLPEEVNDIGSGLRRRQDVKEERERETFEESNFMRLPKKRKGGQSSQPRGGASDLLDDLDLAGDTTSTTPTGGRRGKKVTSSSRQRRLTRESKFKKRGRRHK